MKIKLNDYQKNKIKKNLKNGQGSTIRLKPSQVGVGKEYPLTNKQIEDLKEGKKKRKTVQLILPISQLKTGGFLPLLFAGLGAASALMGGGAAIANVIIDKKDKDKIRAETQRHNEAMERIIAGKVSTVHVGSNLRKKKKIISALSLFDIEKGLEKYVEKGLEKYVEELLKNREILQPLTNFDIYKRMKNIPSFRGCFMRDELRHLGKPHETECGIFNFHVSKKPGIHWVAWVKRGKRKNYFDSYGKGPPIELVKYLGNEYLRFEETQYQTYNSPPFCGHLCIEFIKLMM